MTILFNIDYHASFDEELALCLHTTDGKEKIHKMRTANGDRWTLNVNIKKLADVYEYHYVVTRCDKVIRREWTAIPHRLETGAGTAHCYTVYDRWSDFPEDSYLYSSAFTDCINRQQPATTAETNRALHETPTQKGIRLVVRAPQLRRGETLLLCGSDPLFGSWHTEKALRMTLHAYNEWEVEIDTAKLAPYADGTPAKTLEFKFISRGKDGTLWETRDTNRLITLPGALIEGDTTVYHLGQAFFPIPNQHFAGTLVPVFSLRTARSQGVGDFGDLHAMIDFVAKSGQNVLQLLPINDTTITHTWTDSYPYSCISVFALHPQYADLRALPALADPAEQKYLEETAAELNALPQIDYERVNNFKNAYLRKLYAQEGAKTMRTAAYKRFFEQTKTWLVPYARYSTLREKYGTADFSLWPDHNKWDESERAALTSPRSQAYKDAAFYYYVQYILHTQMTAAHDYARQQGVVLKGDIPIGVHRHSCDVWTEPRYFNLNGQAGAPPDDFSPNGQNWGFPTYNWPEMLKDGCAWWTRRFQNMQHFFDAYRIDHILGFFRIWEIPVNSVHGLLGQFSPSLGMSRDEIQCYGLPFQEDRFLTPFITNWTLKRTFGDRADEVKATYLLPLDDERYRLKPEYDTQRKVEAAFANVTGEADTDETASTNDEAVIALRDGLYTLISCVLFLRDTKNPNLFHPRISAQHDYIYASLSDPDKAAFNRLYDDYFYRRMNKFWYHEAMKKLPSLVEATRMLVCAEDLGMVPDCVPWVMNDLKILSLELQSMPKASSVRFGHLDSFPFRSVTTISSHDMPTLRMWWDEDPSRTQAYYTQMLQQDGKAPHPLPGWLAQDIIARHLEAPSMLCIISIQDWLAISERLRHPNADIERINVPANPKNYWRYRMHLNIEDLIGDNEFMGTIRSMTRHNK